MQCTSYDYIFIQFFTTEMILISIPELRIWPSGGLCHATGIFMGPVENQNLKNFRKKLITRLTFSELWTFDVRVCVCPYPIHLPYP